VLERRSVSVAEDCDEVMVGGEDGGGAEVTLKALARRG